MMIEIDFSFTYNMMKSVEEIMKRKEVNELFVQITMSLIPHSNSQPNASRDLDPAAIPSLSFFITIIILIVFLCLPSK